MHVLEHLVNPSGVLRVLRNSLAGSGRMLILLPNVAAWRVRKGLFFRGAFEYEETGLLDRTHLRFFTLTSARALIDSAGLRVTHWEPTDVCVPLERRLRRLSRSAALGQRWTRLMVRRFPNLCTEIAFFEATL